MHTLQVKIFGESENCHLEHALSLPSVVLFAASTCDLALIRIHASNTSLRSGGNAAEMQRGKEIRQP